MKQYGRTIKVFLSNGSPTGLRFVEIVNWTGQALSCPRSRFSELGDWEEARRPGVYFLIEVGTDGDGGRVYIGESEDVYDRLASHDRDKEFWNDVVIFTNKDENLTKGHIKYLESRLVEISKINDRYRLENGNTPTRSSLPRSDTAAMEEFIENIRLVVGTLGFRMLEPISGAVEQKHDGQDSILNYEFHFTVNDLRATGRVTDDGFLLKTGSQVAHKSSNSMQARNAQTKKQMILDGTLKDMNDHYVLTRDKLMNSSSYAAVIVAGTSRSGPQSWKTEKGENLKSVEARLVVGS